MSTKKICGFGNPLLDISCHVGQDVLDDWGAQLNNAILAEEKHQPKYAELAKREGVEFIAGGATLNSIRVAQWVLSAGTAGANASTAFIGCIGKDEFGETMESQLKADGVTSLFQKVDGTATGTCAVLVKDAERSLIANLAAANCYDKSHFDKPEIQALLAQTKIVYIAGFFLTVSPPTIMAIGEEMAKTNKTMCLNLAAPFIPQFFTEPLNKALYYVDFVFGNESEAAIYGETAGWGNDVEGCALKIAALPKASGSRPRVVVFTQGKDPTVVAVGGTITRFPVALLPKEKLVDTNGAGDSFVGGFLAILAKGGDLAACVNAGNYAARQIIQVSGCKIPSFPPAP